MCGNLSVRQNWERVKLPQIERTSGIIVQCANDPVNLLKSISQAVKLPTFNNEITNFNHKYFLNHGWMTIFFTTLQSVFHIFIINAY